MDTGDDLFNAGVQRAAYLNPAPLVKALRPRQWVKNGLVFVPFIFAINEGWSLGDLAALPGLLLRVIVLCLAFCALSSSVYLFNDLMDREADRIHPLKKRRPIASGKVTVPAAVAVMVALGLGGLATMGLLKPILGAVGLLYVGINLGYSLGAKQVVIVDILVVVSGYVIRAVVGALVISVAPSPWLYVTTAAGALFIILGRRYAEARLAGDNAARQRIVLAHYAGPFIGQLLSISATAALLSYTVYAVEAENLPANDTMLLTVPFVAFGVFRYLYLLNTSAQAESPEHLITRDLPLALSVLGWMVVSALVLSLDSLK